MSTVTSVESPIAASMTRANERIQYLGARSGELPDGWLRCSDVIDDPAALRDLLDQVEALYGMQPGNRQIAAAFLVLGYFWYPMAGAVACYLMDERVPDLRVDQLGMHLRGGAAFTSPQFYALPDDPDAASPDAVIVADRAELRAVLVRQLEAHADPLFATLRAVAPYGLNGMRANYIDRLVSAILWVSEQLGDMERAREEVPACLALLGPGSPASRAGLIEVACAGRRGLYQQRSGCCLNYRLPHAEKCDTCSLRPMEERVSIFQRQLREQGTQTA